MNDTLAYQQNNYDKEHILSLPVGHNLGVYFSDTVPCEISRVDHESPIFDSCLQFIGCLACHLSVPNKIDIYGALDNETLVSILNAYSNIPNRKLKFTKIGESPKEGIFTTTVLPTGPINASFRKSKGFRASRNKVFVKNAGSYTNYEFPTGHYVEKVIIPNQLVLEGGIRTPDTLSQTLDNFAATPGRKIVFQKNIPKGGAVTKITLPKGPSGLVFYSALDDNTSRSAVVYKVLEGSSASRLNVPINHVVEKFIIPNEITIERPGNTIMEQALNDSSEAEGRVIVLREYREFRRDIRKGRAKVTITLPTGKLGILLRSYRDSIWVSQIHDNSPLLRKIPVGYYLESLIIPDELELIGKEEMRNAPYFATKLIESSHISNRIMILQQRKEDVQIRKIGTQFQQHMLV